MAVGPAMATSGDGALAGHAEPGAAYFDRTAEEGEGFRARVGESGEGLSQRNRAHEIARVPPSRRRNGR